MIRAGIIGATGYTGRELADILHRHPDINVNLATSKSFAGRTLRDVYPTAPPLPLTHPDAVAFAGLDVVFLCLPHAAAAATAVAALAASVRVVDLSADFRLKDADVYARWYGVTHPAPELLAEAVYGLTEFARAALPAARLVATPGCYPTGILLALQPLLAAGLAAGPIIADAKSGVSGAGRVPKQNTHFVEVSNNFSPYNIGQAHRHWPEIEQTMRGWQPAAPALIFSPHLLPVPRGILSTIYVPLPAGTSLATVRALYQQTYANEPFVRLLPAGELATLAHANHTNRCVLGLTLVGDYLIVTSAIDNLIKGAAGQAVQNMNVMFGFAETTGLVA